MKKTITIKPEHFDTAVKQPWYWDTCLIAQTNLATDGFTSCDSRRAITQANIKAQEAMIIFDRYFSMPGDETKPELVAFRASLPIVVEVEV